MRGPAWRSVGCGRGRVEVDEVLGLSARPSGRSGSSTHFAHSGLRTARSCGLDPREPRRLAQRAGRRTAARHPRSPLQSPPLGLVYAEPGRLSPRVPREPWPSLVCHVLHERLGQPITLEMLGWLVESSLVYVPADTGLDQVWTGRGAVDALTGGQAGSARRRRHRPIPPSRHRSPDTVRSVRRGGSGWVGVARVSLGSTAGVRIWTCASRSERLRRRRWMQVTLRWW